MKMTFNDVCDLLRKERKQLVDGWPYSEKELPNSGQLGESFDGERVVDALRKYILAHGALVVSNVTIGLGTSRSALISTDAAKFRRLLERWRMEAMQGVGKEIHERWKSRNRVRLPAPMVGSRKFQGFD